MIRGWRSKPGYLMPEPEDDADLSFTGAPEDYPEEWIETGPRGSIRLRSDRRRLAPRELTVDAGWSRRHDRTPRVVPARQVPLLPGLQGSAASAGARDQQAGEPVRRGPQLGDDSAGVERAALDERRSAARCRPTSASCSASPTIARTPRCRPAISTISCSSLCCAPQHLRRCERQGPRGLREDEFGRRVQAALGFTAAERERRQEWMLDPEVEGVGLIEAERTLARVLAHRVWVDQRRGWRFTNPNLEELGLVRADYVALDELAADDERVRERAGRASRRHPRTRRKEALLDPARSPCASGLAVTADALEPGQGRGDCQCVAAEPARALVDLAAGEPARLRRR